MSFRRRALTAALLSFVLVGGLIPGSAKTDARALALPKAQTFAQAAPAIARARPKRPVPIFVPEPHHGKPAARRAANLMRPHVSYDVRIAHGRPVPEPPMLKASEIMRIVAAERLRPSSIRTPSAQATPSQRTVQAPGAQSGAKPVPGERVAGQNRLRAQSTPNGQSGTGFRPWWVYQNEKLPGFGSAMLNLGTGNMMIRVVDMNVPHKGVPLIYARTFNSQSLHDAAGSDGSWPSMYGNGWTSTYDVRMAGNDVTGPLTVWDDTGTRNDYTWNGSSWVPPPGVHATLASDGACGFLWTQKSGLTYYLYRLEPTPSCPGSLAQSGGFAGRLHEIIGRNSNTHLVLSYSWDNGYAGPNGLISSITVTAESGLSATISYATVGGARVASMLTRPDGTTVQYGYGAVPYLGGVIHPSNNNPNTIREGYDYIQAPGGFYVMDYTTGPKWNESCVEENCGGDGGYTQFAYNYGSTLATTSLSQIDHFAMVNPAIGDGISSGVMQAGYSPYYSDYLTEYFGTGTTATLRDSDQHVKNWIIDTSGRPTQFQAATVNSTTFLTTNLTWDGNNNLVTSINPGGLETDFAYDAAGNLVALGKPLVQDNTYAQGALYQPTYLFDYDAYNNVVAYCDPVELFPNNEYNSNYTTGSDSLCTSTLGTANHRKFSFSYPSYEPYGELTGTTQPSGYAQSIAYDASAQGGVDYGLPTRFYSTQITQFDGSGRTPSKSVVYDANGNPVCVKADSSSSATAIMAYDSMNRLTASADPDDASLTSPLCSKTPGIPGSTIVTNLSYYNDGSLATIQSPAEAAQSYGILISYDYDGNPTSEAPYHPNAQSPLTATVRRWFDGADRLVEVLQPADPATPGDFPLAMRYVYDISAGGTPATLSGQTVTAHGNMFNVRKNTPTGWTDFRYDALDLDDRVTTDYQFAPCPASGTTAGPIYCAQAAFATRYDWDSSSLNSNVAPGKLVAVLDALGESKLYSYDYGDRLVSLTYGGDGGVTEQLAYYYDMNSRVKTADNGLPNLINNPNYVTYSYLPDGELSQINNIQLNATTSYSYYADGALENVASTAGSVVNQPNFYQYSYRSDGLLAHEQFGVSNQSVQYAYTGGGRFSTETDFGSSPSVSAQYDAHGLIANWSTPAGAYAPSGYDFQGRMLGYSAFNGESVSSQYNIRGTLVGRTFTPNPANGNTGYPSFPGFHYSDVQGVLVQNPTDQYDGRTGAPLILGGASPMSYDTLGRLAHAGSTSYSYDAENRLLTGDTTALTTAGDVGCSTGGISQPGSGTTEISYKYDANGQLFQDLIRQGSNTTTRQWVRDPRGLLYTGKAASGGGLASLDVYEADGLGTVSGGSPGLTISDLDFDGAVALHHNDTGYSTWYASNPYHQECISANPVPSSPNYVGPAASLPSDDGSSDGSVTISSVGRAYLSRANGFMTPDFSSATPYARHSIATLSRRRASDANRSQSPDLSGQCASGWKYDDTGECAPTPNIGGVTANICGLDCMAAFFAQLLYLYNLEGGRRDPAEGGSVGYNPMKPATHPIVQIVSKVKLCLPVSSVTAQGTVAVVAGGITVTNQSNVLLTGGLATPGLGGSVVGTPGSEPPSPGLTFSAGAAGGGAFDFNVDVISGQITPDVGVGLGGPGASLTATLPTPFTAPAIGSTMCQGGE